MFDLSKGIKCDQSRQRKAVNVEFLQNIGLLKLVKLLE